jgi:hypothetical protein
MNMKTIIILYIFVALFATAQLQPTDIDGGKLKIRLSPSNFLIPSIYSAGIQREGRMFCIPEVCRFGCRNDGRGSGSCERGGFLGTRRCKCERS